MYTCAYVCVLAHVLCDNNNGCYLGIDRSRPARFVGEAVQHQTPARAASRIPAALLAVLALALDPLVGAHAFAAAEAPDAVMLADAGAPAVLAGAPGAILLADAGARQRAGRMEGATGAQQGAGVRPTDSPHTGQAEARAWMIDNR